MAVTLSADLSLEMHQLHTVVWVMTSWVRSLKNGMTTCYQCDDKLSTTSSSLLTSPSACLGRCLPDSSPPLTTDFLYAVCFHYLWCVKSRGHLWLVLDGMSYKYIAV